MAVRTEFYYNCKAHYMSANTTPSAADKSAKERKKNKSANSRQPQVAGPAKTKTKAKGSSGRFHRNQESQGPTLRATPRGGLISKATTLTLFFDRLRQPFRKDKDFSKKLYNILGFYPHNTEFYRVALTHSSAENRGGVKPLNNERLEFLGDAVLEMVVSDIVYKHFDRKREGFLTGTRSKIVQRATLNQLADKMGVMKLVRVSKQPTTQHNNIGGNAFEALVGAVYLDRGYDFCYRFVAKRVLGRYLNLDAVAQKEENFKSKLLEWSQKNKLKAEFVAKSDEKTHPGNSVFISVVYIEGVKTGEGKGYSKKESHQNAAKDALTKLRRDQRLHDSLFKAKEERTQMEAAEYAALPSPAGKQLLVMDGQQMDS